MEQDRHTESGEEQNRIEIGFLPEENSPGLLVNIDFFILAVKAFYKAADSRERKYQVQRILTAKDWIEHYKDKHTGRRVLSESISIEYDHEKLTAISLTQVNYDVVFAPKGMFRRNDKKFDIYLLRDSIILEADLKCISSKRPDTIADRIIDGSEQAGRVVLDIRSDVQSKDLIDGLRAGTGKNNLMKEVLLFYKGKFYKLPRNLIWSKKIFGIL